MGGAFNCRGKNYAKAKTNNEHLFPLKLNYVMGYNCSPLNLSNIQFLIMKMMN